MAVHQTPLPGQQEIDSAHEYSPRKLEIIADDVKDELRLLDGVAKAEKYGVIDEAIYVETDMGTWSQLGLTTDQLKRLTEVRNIVAPGGNIDTPAGRFAVKPAGDACLVLC